jgi:alpha-L-fucosidase
VGNHFGDYAVQEQKIPAGGEPQPWETCMTLNGHWGYFLGDEKWKPARTVIQNLVDIVSKGGNYLLNVGPTGQGVIPEGAVNDLRQVGEWMKINGKSIYGTSASPLKAQPAWGRVTKNGATLYLHIFDWPQDGKLTVEDLKMPARNAYLLADKKEHLKFTSTPVSSGSSTVIELPAKPIDPVDTVIVLQL